MANYISEVSSKYRILCTYSFDDEINLNDIFDALKPDEFLMFCSFEKITKKYNINKEFTTKEKFYIKYLGRSSFLKCIKVLAYMNEQLFPLIIFKHRIEIADAPSIPIGNMMINKLIEKISANIETKINIESIKPRHSRYFLRISHAINNEIILKIKAKWNDFKEFKKIALIGFKTDFGTLYLHHKNENISFSSFSIHDYAIIRKFLNDFFSEIYNCAKDCIECNKKITETKDTKDDDIYMNEETQEEGEYVLPDVLYI